ncbi:MAG TPA: urea ABC transporter permease subunit UrtB [Acidimicrobiales bacterium]|jgi:urea transport system permease protein|nr:urea ABC transporter permease subunit UrtB [Acidimicrobiales bacterium]
MSNLLEQVFNGLSVGWILLLVALGLTFTFGQMGVINMAHGELIMAGAYTPYVLQTEVGLFAGAASTAFVVALPVAFLVAGAIGLLLERLLLARMVDRPLDTLLVTFGVSLLLQQAARDLFGAPNVEVVAPSWLRGRWVLADVTMPHSRLFIMALGLVVIAAVWAFMNRSSQGRRIRAVMQNRDLAEVSGLASRRVDALTFFLGSGLAGIAGVGVTLIGSIGSQVGTGYVIDAFLVVIVGGLGKLRGAVIAAFALGMLNVFAEYWTNASLGKAVVFAAVVAFLQFRPNGLVSFRTRGLAT